MLFVGRLALRFRRLFGFAELLDFGFAQRTVLELQRAEPAELVVFAGQQANAGRLIVAKDARILLGVELDQIVSLKFRIDLSLFVVQSTVIVERLKPNSFRWILERRSTEIETTLLERKE